MFRNFPPSKVVYIAPLKALVRERIADWKDRLECNNYCLSHETMEHFRSHLSSIDDCYSNTLEELLAVSSHCHEYDELPVRCNEELLNGELTKQCRIAVNPQALDSFNTKTHLLFQAHFSRLNLPCADYATDTKSVRLRSDQRTAAGFLLSFRRFLSCSHRYLCRGQYFRKSEGKSSKDVHSSQCLTPFQ